MDLEELRGGENRYLAYLLPSAMCAKISLGVSAGVRGCDKVKKMGEMKVNMVDL